MIDSHFPLSVLQVSVLIYLLPVMPFCTRLAPDTPITLYFWLVLPRSFSFPYILDLIWYDRDFRLYFPTK